MTWNMVTDADVLSLPVPDRLFEYAEAYLRAANAMCQQLVQDNASMKWSNAAVVLMLAAHAAELFLKGAILTRAPAEDVWSRGHRLLELSADYRSLFPEPSFQWEVPFQAEFPAETAGEELEALKKKTPAPSILYRYPVQKGGEEWHGVFGFEASSFLLLLSDMSRDFTRIRAQLA